MQWSIRIWLIHALPYNIGFPWMVRFYSLNSKLINTKPNIFYSVFSRIESMLRFRYPPYNVTILLFFFLFSFLLVLTIFIYMSENKGIRCFQTSWISPSASYWTTIPLWIDHKMVGQMVSFGISHCYSWWTDSAFANEDGKPSWLDIESLKKMADVHKFMYSILTKAFFFFCSLPQLSFSCCLL